MCNFRFPVDLLESDRRQAEYFSQPYLDNSDKSRQIYLNVLAAAAVMFFCQCVMGIDEELQVGDGYHICGERSMRVIFVKVPELGKIECYGVTPGRQTCWVRPTIVMGVIGRAIVEIHEQESQAFLLGFVPVFTNYNPSNQGLIKIPQQLEHLERTLERFHRLKSGNQFLLSTDSVAIKVREKLRTKNIQQVVAQLEWIYSSKHQYEWTYAAENVLVGAIADGDSSERFLACNGGEVLDIELFELAEGLMGKLKWIWR